MTTILEIKAVFPDGLFFWFGFLHTATYALLSAAVSADDACMEPSRRSTVSTVLIAQLGCIRVRKRPDSIINGVIGVCDQWRLNIDVDCILARDFASALSVVVRGEVFYSSLMHVYAFLKCHAVIVLNIVLSF